VSIVVLDPDQLRGELKEGTIHPVYLLAGADGFRAERTARWLREKVVDPAMGGLNAESIWADERTPAQIVESSAAYPMFGGRRFLWVRHAEKIPTGAAVEPLLRYLERPAESTVLVLTASKLDKRLKLTAACAHRGRVVDFGPLQGVAQRAQVRRQAREQGFDLDARAIEALLELVGEDLAEIDGELGKLALLLDEGAGAVDEATVREMVARSRDIDAFELADSLDPRHPETALRRWFDLRQRGGDVMGAAAILAWRLRQLAQLRAAMDDGLSASDAARQIGLSPWHSKRLTPLLANYSSQGLHKTLEAFRRADRRAKGLGIDAGAAYDLALLEWSRLAAS
jgi:DNA polymerase-3 subunit delta